MASGKWTFTQTYKGWNPGDSIEPNMCLAGGEFRLLRTSGALVQAEKYKERKKRGRPPVVETADAPPTGETAAKTTRAVPARLTKVRTSTSKEVSE